jgi:hypothetical protein
VLGEAHDIDLECTAGKKGDFKVTVNGKTLLDKLSDPTPFIKMAANPSVSTALKPYPKPGEVARVCTAVGEAVATESVEPSNAAVSDVAANPSAGKALKPCPPEPGEAARACEEAVAAESVEPSPAAVSDEATATDESTAE